MKSNFPVILHIHNNYKIFIIIYLEEPLGSSMWLSIVATALFCILQYYDFLFIVSFLPIVPVVNLIWLDLKPMEVNAQSIINLNRLVIRPAANALIGTGQGL